MKKEIKQRIKKKYNNQCYFCGQPATNLHHIIPKSIGGKDEIWNLIPLCESCAKKVHKIIDPLVKIIQISKN